MCNSLRFLFSLLISFTAVLIGTARASEDSLPTVQKNLQEQKAVLVDVREQAEWNKGHLEGAVLVPLSAMRDATKTAELTKQIAKDRILYTYCAAGKRSVMSVEFLETLGYQVLPLKSGYKDLLKAGFKAAEK